MHIVRYLYILFLCTCTAILIPAELSNAIKDDHEITITLKNNETIQTTYGVVKHIKSLKIMLEDIESNQEPIPIPIFLTKQEWNLFKQFSPTISAKNPSNIRTLLVKYLSENAPFIEEKKKTIVALRNASDYFLDIAHDHLINKTITDIAADLCINDKSIQQYFSPDTILNTNIIDKKTEDVFAQFGNFKEAVAKKVFDHYAPLKAFVLMYHIKKKICIAIID